MKDRYSEEVQPNYKIPNLNQHQMEVMSKADLEKVLSTIEDELKKAQTKVQKQILNAWSKLVKSALKMK